MSRSQRAAAGFSASVIQYVTMIVLQAALAPLLLKYGGREMLGTYATVIQLTGYGALIDLGFAQALSRYLAQACGEPHADQRFREVFTTGRTFFLGSNFVYAAFITGTGTHSRPSISPASDPPRSANRPGAF